MIYIGLDPSFQRTGMAITEDFQDWEFHSIQHPGNSRTVTMDMENAFQIVKEVKTFMEPYLGNDFCVGVEYPIMATLAGAYLSFITSKIDSLFRGLKMNCIYYLPSVAVASFTATKSKTELVQWAKINGHIKTPKKYNHDEVTAAALAMIAKGCKDKTYKKSFFFRDYTKPLVIKDPKK